jgi:hypothetical protein
LTGTPTDGANKINAIEDDDAGVAPGVGAVVCAAEECGVSLVAGHARLGLGLMG